MAKQRSPLKWRSDSTKLSEKTPRPGFASKRVTTSLRLKNTPAKSKSDELHKKVAVYPNRIAGCFNLTGSAKIFLLPRLPDSLAGRMEVLRLHPLAKCKLVRRILGF